jgi:hypothetical protein
MVIIIFLGALLAIQVYVKRGLMGRWKSSIDELGEQYDPRVTDTNIQHVLVQTTNTEIMTFNTLGGYWTKRTDAASSSESKSGYMSLGSY